VVSHISRKTSEMWGTRPSSRNQRQNIVVPAPDFQSGERVFKPAKTLGISSSGL
jgi:hypothetical protein